MERKKNVPGKAKRTTEKKSSPKKTAMTPLRRRAEKELSRSKKKPLPLKGGPQRLIHELQVHQVELEMQNEELRRAQEELETSRQQYINLYDFAPAGYFTFNNLGRVIEANLSASRMLGVEQAHLLRSVFAEFIAPEYRDVFRAHRQKVLQNGSAQECELKLIRKDGSAFYVVVRSEGVQGKTDLIRSAFLDITKRKEAQQQVEMEHRFREAIENSLISGIAAVDPEGRLTHVNPAFCGMVGWSEKELVGAEFPFIFCPPEEAENIKQAFQKMRNGGKTSGRLEIRLRRRSGERFDVLVFFSAIKDKKGNITGWAGSVGDITESQRKNREIGKLNRELEERVRWRTAEAEEARKKAETILKSISDGFMAIDRGGRYTYVNEAAAVLLKTSAEALVGQKFFEAFPEAQGTLFEKNFRRALEEKVPIFFEAYSPRLKSWFECRCYPSAEGISVFFTDKTDEKAREEELARQNELTAKAEEELKIAWQMVMDEKRRLQTILDTVPSGVMITEEPDGRMVYMNRKALEIYGREGLIGMGREERLRMLGLKKPTGELLEPEELPLRRALKEREMVRDFELMVEHPNGQTLTVSVNASPLFNEAGKITGAVGTLHDISGLKSEEMEIRKLNEILERHARELENSNRDLDAFTSTAAHDLKTPLIVISSLSQRLRKLYESGLDDKGREYFNYLENASRQMIELVEDLLQFSRIGKRSIKFEDLDLSSMAAEIVEDLQKATTEQKIQVRVADGMTARGDKGLIRSAITNLLENAFKFTVKTDQPRVEFGVAGETNPPTFFVRDNGCGFDMSDAHLLFLPFQRLHKTQEYPGTGLGLATVKRILERHGGKIWAEGEEGKGATFYFTLPGMKE